MHSETALILTVLVLCYTAVSGLVRRWYLAPALTFVVLGIVLGPSCLGLIEVGSDRKVFTLLSELALTMILFNRASTLNLQSVVAGCRGAANCSWDGSARGESEHSCSA